MRNSNRALLLMPLLLAGCTYAYRVERVGSGGVTGRLDSAAIFYSLPRTAVTATATVRKIEIEKAKCRALKEDDLVPLLNELDLELKDSPSADSMKFKIEKVDLALAPEPDPSQVFAILVENRQLQKRLLGVELSEAGLLTSGKTEAESQVAQYASAAFAAAAGIAGKVITLGAPAPGATAATPPSLLDYCKEAKDEVVRVRSDLAKIISPTGITVLGGTPKETIEYMIAQLKAREEILLAPLTGERTVKLATAICTFRPDTRYDAASMELKNFRKAQSQQLFQFSATSGVLPTSPDCQVPKEILADGCAGACENYRLEVTASEGSLASQVAASQRVASGSSGFFYRVPAPAVVEVLAGDETKSRLDGLIAQHGVVASLPGPDDLRGALQKVEMNLYSSTGALQKFGSSVAGPDAAALTTAAGGVETILDAEAARRKAAAAATAAAVAATDELALLERERKLLEERKKIEDLRKALGIE